MTDRSENLLLVTIVDQPAAIPVSAVEAVIEVGRRIASPCAPAMVAGLMTLRGRVLTVIDPAARLGLERQRPLPEIAVVVSVLGHDYALLVDSAEEVYMVGNADRHSAPVTLAAGWPEVEAGLARLGGHTAICLNLEALIDGMQRAEAA
jgi:purine-binding chemotaxis protein CheW